MPDAPADGAPGGGATLLQRLFEHSRELLFVIGPDSKFQLVNPAWTQATGWSEAELLDATPASLIHPDDLPDFGRMVEELFAKGVAENVARVKMKDGSWRWFEGRNRLTDDGLATGALRDVTEERERQAELEQARRTRMMLTGAAGISAWTFEPDQDRVIWSDEILHVTGYRADEIADTAAFEALLHPEERSRVQAIFIAGAVKGEPCTFEHRLKAKAGRWTTWRATFHTELRPSGAYALHGVSQDITELSEARDAARRNEQEIRQLIESAPYAVAMFDRNLRYMVTSGTWRRAFSLEHREHIGRRLLELFPACPKRLLNAQKRALAGEVVRAKEDRFKDHAGASHWVRWEARPWRDARGRIKGVICYVDDISVAARARHEAEENARRLKLALQAADAGVYEIDHVAKTFWGSPEFKKLLGAKIPGYEEAQTLRFPRFHPDDLPEVRRAFNEMRHSRGVSSQAFEARAITDAGQERWVRVFHHLERNRKGERLKGVGLVQDFDVRKRQELELIEAQRAAHAANEAKAAFLANMSHEIRTPMNGVMGVLHLLKDEALSAEGRRMLEEALSCGQMLSELLNDVIDFSKIEAGRLELNYEPIDPYALIDGVARLLRPQAEEKGLQLLVDAPADLGWVRTDPVRLRQALFNLIGNAVKFTLEGQVVVRASLKGGAGGQMLRLEVADTGVGIPEAVQPRIFQRFDQGDASTTRRFGGSGLGLAITRRLAEMMGGGVGFASTEGVGSVFWLEVTAPSAAAALVEAESGENWLDGMRILLVEDNPTNRMIATRMLENLGAVIETAADGLLGVEAASRGEFDLILMDVQMPGIDGLEASRRIRALGGARAATPIVALTANVLAHQRQAYLEAGMDGVVGKPISPGALLAEIARLSHEAAAA